MKNILTHIATTIALILGSLFNTVAQGFELKGKLVNEQKQAILFANVSLHLAKDSSLIKAGFSNEEGTFLFKQLAENQYFVKISSVEFKPKRITDINLNQNQNLGEILLETGSTNLAEVTVKATKPMIEVRADKTIFNVQQSMSSAGSNGLELLRKAPGVILDQNENLIVEGKTGVRVFIDGKPSVLVGQDLTDFLKTLQASSIEAIEIITQPSARYDAGGTAGIINIKLKKDTRLGTNGSVNLGGGYGRFGKGNAGLSFNNRNKKANLYGNIGSRMGQDWSFINLYRQQSGMVFDQRSESVNENQSLNTKIGYDYTLSKKSTLGFIAMGNLNSNVSETDARTPISKTGSELIENVLLSPNTSESDSRNFFLNGNYRFDNQAGKTLDFDVDFGNYNNNRSSFQPNYYFDGSEKEQIFARVFSMQTPTDINLFSTKTDYEQKLGKGKLAIGAKYSNVQTNNVFDFFNVVDNREVLNTNRSNAFDFTEQILAGYANYDLQVKKVNLQFGLRAEQTRSLGRLKSQQVNDNNKVERQYTNLFPSGGLSFNQNANSSWAVSYSRRIERPNYQSLNPFEYQLSELTFMKGNPFLQPQYVNTFKVTNTYKYRLNTALSYSRVNDFFAEITDTLGVDKTFMMTQNIATQHIVNANVSLPFNVKKWWSVYFSLDAYRSSFVSASDKFVPLTAHAVSFYGQNTFKLPQGFSVEASGWYSSPSIWGGTYRTRHMGAFNLAVQKAILKKKMNVQLSANDIFFTSPWKGESQFGDLKINGNGGWESRVLRLNLSYKFGNNNVKSARQRKTSSEDAKSRIQ